MTTKNVYTNTFHSMCRRVVSIMIATAILACDAANESREFSLGDEIHTLAVLDSSLQDGAFVYEVKVDERVLEIVEGADLLAVREPGGLPLVAVGERDGQIELRASSHSVVLDEYPQADADVTLPPEFLTYADPIHLALLDQGNLEWIKTQSEPQDSIHLRLWPVILGVALVFCVEAHVGSDGWGASYSCNFNKVSLACIKEGGCVRNPWTKKPKQLYAE